MTRRSVIDFILLAALWGGSFLFMRLAAREFGAMPTAGLRVGIAALVLLPVLLWRGQWPAARAHWRPILFVGLMNSGLPFALISWALLSITSGFAAIVNAMVPLFGALVAWVWLNDRLDRLRVLGLLLGFGGVAALAWQTPGAVSFKPGGSGWALGACLLACLCYAIGANGTRKYLKGVPPLATTTGSLFGATLALLGPTIWFWPATTPSPLAWSAAFAVAILCTGIAYILYFRLIESAGPARALAVTFLVPVFALVYGVLALAEQVSMAMMICGVVIGLGTGLSTGLVGRSGNRG